MIDGNPVLAPPSPLEEQRQQARVEDDDQREGDHDHDAGEHEHLDVARLARARAALAEVQRREPVARQDQADERPGERAGAR